DLPLLSQASGALHFDENGFALRDMRATFLGGAVSLSGGSQPGGDIEVKADGTLSAEGLRRAYSAQEWQSLQPLLERIAGATRYNATVQVRSGRTGITVASALNG